MTLLRKSSFLMYFHSSDFECFSGGFRYRSTSRFLSRRQQHIRLNWIQKSRLRSPGKKLLQAKFNKLLISVTDISMVSLYIHTSIEMLCWSCQCVHSKVQIQSPDTIKSIPTGRNTVGGISSTFSKSGKNSLNVSLSTEPGKASKQTSWNPKTWNNKIHNRTFFRVIDCLKAYITKLFTNLQ